MVPLIMVSVSLSNEVLLARDDAYTGLVRGEAVFPVVGDTVVSECVLKAAVVYGCVVGE